MKLPQLDNPQDYRGSYIFDFGEWTAVGYTAEEIAILLESEAHRSGSVYKIIRVSPEGGLELRGVPAERFQKESGLLFNRDHADAARDDYQALIALAEQDAPPCRCFVRLIDRGQISGVVRFATALVYPAEYEDEVSNWLLRNDYAGGDTVEGGPSHVADIYAESHTVLERQQLWSRTSTASRSADEVLRNVRQAVQR